MDGTIEIDTKIDSTGAEKGVNSVNKSLKKVDNSLSETSRKMADTFTGSQSKIDALTSKLEKQNLSLEKNKNSIEKMKNEYERFLQTGGKEKEFALKEKQFEETITEIEKLEEELIKLEDNMARIKSQDIIDENDKRIIQETEIKMDSLNYYLKDVRNNSDKLAEGMKNMRIDPATSKEAEVFAKKIELAEQKSEILNNEIGRTKNQMEELNKAKGIESIKEEIKEVGKETKKTSTAIDRFAKRIKRLVIAVFVFNILRRALDNLRKYIGSLLVANAEFANSLNQIKTGLSVAFQPIYEAILPAINSLMRALAKAIAYIAYFTNALFGKTVSQSKKNAEALNKQAEAIKNAGKSAKDAGKSMAGFDKANVLSSNSGGGAGGGLSDIIGSTELPEIDVSIFDRVQEKLGEVMGWLKATFGPSWNSFWKALQPNLEKFKDNTSMLFEGLIPIWEKYKTYLIEQWLPAFIEIIDIIGRIFNGLFETFNMVIGHIIEFVLLPFLDTLVEHILPVMTEFGLEMWKTFETTFNLIKEIFDKVWTEGIMPAVELFTKIWQDMWTSIDEAWKKWGEPIFKSIREAIDNMKENLNLLWDNVLRPIWDKIVEMVRDIWDNNLKGLLENILDMIGELIHGALEIYNKFISPIVQWLIKLLGPTFAKIFNSILDIVGKTIGNIINFINGLITVIKGIIKFITGVFTGDWKKAWEGVKTIFKGVFESLKTIFKEPINFMISGLNLFTKGLNKIKVPDWVPVVGGKSINLPTIPKLAKGAVIPPNKEFLAIMGDQKHGTNIETPEALLRKVVREESGSSEEKQIIVKAYIGDEEVYVRFEKYLEDKKFALNGGL